MRRDLLRSARGFSLTELLVVVALIGILASVAVGIAPSVIQTAKGEGSSSQIVSFLKRTREMAISRRRNIVIRFPVPGRIESLEVPVPPAGPALIPLETMSFEQGLELMTFPGQGDTPDALGLAGPLGLGGAEPVMFTSEGSFVDAAGDPTNASLFFGIDDKPWTSNAVTILGPTAAVRAWRWNGPEWIR